MSRDALVVGINNYKSEVLPHLSAPYHDAEEIATRLETDGDFQVWRMPEAIDSKTNKPFIGKTLNVSLSRLQAALVKLFKPDGDYIPETALFYFSGHGVRQNLGIAEGFLATSDVYPEKNFNGLSLQWLRRLLQESPVRQQIIWLDCCHSGELVNFEEANPTGKGKDRFFLASSREFESAYEDLASEYSVVTKILLEGLNPHRCPQEWVTNYSLVDYLNKHLHHANQRIICTNSGEKINLTRTSQVKTTQAKGDESTDICPYQGLEYFKVKDAPYFYGREKLTDELLNRIRKSNFVAILGASGSGKSSVLRAGLLYELQQGRKITASQDWKVQVIVPTDSPMNSLALSFLNPNDDEIARASKLDEVETLLKKGASGFSKLIQATKSERFVLVIDQFEEIFTLVQGEESQAIREDFLQCIFGALKENPDKLCVIVAMRADFLLKCLEAEYSGLAQQIEANLVTVTPMNEKELTAAITKPAEVAKLNIEKDLVSKILADVKNSSASLPLLQDTLTELWKRRNNNCLELKTYTKLGGVAGTLNQRATEVYQQFDSQAKKETVKHIFLCLTQLGEGTEDTRRRVFKEDLITSQHSESLIDEVIKKLADEKLIVTNDLSINNPNAVEDKKQNPNTLTKREIKPRVIVDVAHEALIRSWLLLREWLNESRDIIRKQRKFENLAQEWRKEGKKADYLLTGKRLREGKEFQKEYAAKYPLSNLAVTFIEASIKNRFKSIGLYLIIPLLGVAIGGYFIVREYMIQADLAVVRNCEGKEYCHGRIEALEDLVKAKKSLKSFNFKDANLSSADFSSANLIDANLIDANLSDANLKSANLKSANLRYANLSNANLKSANLSNTYLSNANLIDANLIDANLTSANLFDATLSNANLSNANLKSANLFDTYLKSANLSSANLLNANFKSAYLFDANFQNANFQDANLNYAYLSSANLKSVNLSNANLKHANLIAVKNLTNAQIKLACNWEKAIYFGTWNNGKGEWIINEEENQKRIAELKEDKNSDPKVKPDCSRWK